MALPTNVDYGTVVGQFLLAYGDGIDADVYPDGAPAKGSIYFRPSPAKLLNAASSPNPVTILPAVVECTLDANGYLLGPDGTQGVNLVATDDTDLNPTDWTWLVEFRLTDQDDVPVSVASYSIELPASTTVDLTTVSPVPSASGTYYLVGPTGPTGPTGATGPAGDAATIAAGTTTTGAAGTSASVSNSGTSSAAVFDFTIPRGDTGATGATGTAATIAVGTVTTGAAGSSATVTNSGSSSAAVFDFTIPKGDDGDVGSLSANAPVTYNSGTSTIGFDWSGTSIDDLADVSAGSPSSNDMLKYNSVSSAWEPSNIIDGGSA
jgi:hypothetical protein